MTKLGWIGVDLDGTLAYYHGDVHTIGDPIPAMAERVSRWLCEGRDVRIFTARVACPAVSDSLDVYVQEKMIEQWCQKHFGTVLQITCSKDYGCDELWDDRARQVVFNTGELIEKAPTPPTPTRKRSRVR